MQLSIRIRSRRNVGLVAIVLAAGLILAACRRDQQLIAVYVTPTPADTVAAVVPTVPPSSSLTPTPPPTATASATATPTLTATATVTPSATATASATASPVPPAASPTATTAPGVVFGPVVGPDQPTAVFATATPVPGMTYGPIIGPNHTLIPTETSVPALIPTIAATAGPSPTPGPGLRSGLLGIQIHPHIDSREFDTVMSYAHQLGVTWIKVQFNWSLLESSPGQYTEMFYMLRLYVQRAHDQGFKVLVSVAKAPGWSRTPDADGIMREDGPPDNPAVLANFLSGMLAQIGRDGYGRPYVSAVEIWNEPNLRREWHNHTLSGDEYMRYFRPAYSTIRSYSPDIAIITAGPAPTGDSDGSINDRNWLQQLYNAGLAAYGTDIVLGVHPYGWANAPDARCCANPSRGWDDQPQFYFLDTIEDYRTIMVNNGHGSAQMWGTEFGWATFDGMQTANGTQPVAPADTPYFTFINRWQQADYVLRAFTLAQERPYLGPMMLWNLNFALIPGAVDQSDPKTAYSLLDSQWRPRPVYQTLQQAAKH